MATVTFVRIESLEKRHGAKTIFKALDLSVDAGEFVAVVGPSGCGKTSLLQILAGLDSASNGRCVYGKPDPKIGVVFQNPRLLPWRTVRENLEIVMGEDHRDGLVEEWIARVDLADAIDQYPDRLSLGMMRRVALARAFAIEPDLLLMDEPLVSLDAPTARKMRALLMTLWNLRPHTVIFVTHDLREAVELADRLLFVSPSPMQVVADVKVAIPRDERSGERIEEWVNNLRSGPSGIDAWL